QQMAKEKLLFLFADPEDAEHFRLQLRLMDADAAAADLDSVQDHIVGFGPHLGITLLVEQRQVFGFRPGKGMMNGVPLVGRGVELEERKLRYPKKVEYLRAFRQALDLRDPQA